MDNNELIKLWSTYDIKLDNVLSLNRDIAISLTKQKLDKTISGLYLPKMIAIIIGIPYTILLSLVTIIAICADAYFVALGFGAIAIIMVTTLFVYFYHLYLIRQVKLSGDIISTQQHLSRLKISSYNCLRFSIFQLPFWSVCWVSVDAIFSSSIIYIVVNLCVFMGLSYLAFWLYKQLSLENEEGRIRNFLLSGSEWEPIIKSTKILEQLKGY